MYRYHVDNAVTYTPDDLVLFRESPFALWMERLTLENPGHGIPPDRQANPPRDEVDPQLPLVDALRAEGRDVAVIDWQREEAGRRADTLDAMRSGADFVVNGQLSLGPLAGRVAMLMRTSGYSELGDFIYIPCDTQSRNVFESAFRLSFHADLLQELQGQLPPQLLIIRGEADVVPLPTEDHIHYYRAVKQRCMAAMGSFRKHRMPDPAESAHFGRWSACASEVLRQRALSGEVREEEVVAAEDDPQSQPALAVEAVEDAAAAESADEFALAVGTEHRRVAGERVSAFAARSRLLQASASISSQSLAEQARALDPGVYSEPRSTGHTPNVARAVRLASVTTVEVITDSDYRDGTPGAQDAMLRDLAFIGSAADVWPPPVAPSTAGREPPPPSLRDPSRVQARDAGSDPVDAAGAEGLREPKEPALLPPDPPLPQPLHSVHTASAPSSPALSGIAAADSRPRPDSPGSVVDLDSAPPPTLAPLRLPEYADIDELQENMHPENARQETVRQETMRRELRSPDPLRRVDARIPPPRVEAQVTPLRGFSDTLITNRDDD